MIEILSPGNKGSRNAFRAFVDKACELLEQRIHLLLIDPFPPGPRDPNGVHAAIWAEVQDDSFVLPADKPLTFVSYECDLTIRAYIEPVAVGDVLPDMALFLEPNGCIKVPLEATYETAFAVMPRRWRDELEPPVAIDFFIQRFTVALSKRDRHCQSARVLADELPLLGRLQIFSIGKQLKSALASGNAVQ